MILHPYKLTFIPLWLENAMARYGMKFSDAFDDKKLLDILSKQDIVFYLLSNTIFKNAYLAEHVLPTGFFSEKDFSSLLQNEDICHEYNVALSEIYRNPPTSYTLEKLVLQYNLGLTVDIENFNDKKFEFITQLIDDENVIIRMRILENDIPTYKIFGNFYEQLLKMVNYHFPFHQIASTSLFGKYCNYIGINVDQ